MHCECEYCLYNESRRCQLGKTQINTLGMCDACLLADIPEDILKALKEKQREALQHLQTQNAPTALAKHKTS